MKYNTEIPSFIMETIADELHCSYQFILGLFQKLYKPTIPDIIANAVAEDGEYSSKLIDSIIEQSQLEYTEVVEILPDNIVQAAKRHDQQN
jgi:hypothetical protein